jgi:hypothetical protein
MGHYLGPDELKSIYVLSVLYVVSPHIRGYQYLLGSHLLTLDNCL